MNIMIWVWLGAIVLFGAVEAATAGLVSIWFVAGSAAALIAAALHAQILAQVLAFVIVSGITLAATRPLVKKLSKRDVVATNADRVLGEDAKVTEEINNQNSTGAVYVDGKTWSARSADGTVIPLDALVRVERMEGVKLYVERTKVMEEMK
jgi:membrane protein implicated in regulation of membrane protease activity